MSSVERWCLYFDKAGKQNTESLLEFVKKYALENGIKDIVVASTTGETGSRASEIFNGFNVVVPTHHFRFAEPNKTEMLEDHGKKILANGAKIMTGTHALSGPESNKAKIRHP